LKLQHLFTQFDPITNIDSGDFAKLLLRFLIVVTSIFLFFDFPN